MLLYARSLVRVATLRISDITMHGDDIRISLGKDRALSLLGSRMCF